MTHKLDVRRIESEQTYEWLLNRHYAKRIPQIMFAFGLYEERTLIGVCTFGIPASRSLCMGICGIEYVEKVLELNRLCLANNNKNEASFFVSKCLLMLPRPNIIVSYADTSMNHNGYVYQATNFIYTGLSAKRTERYDIHNPNKHSKTVTQRKDQKYDELAVRERPRKHRYIYFVGNKKEKKEMRSNLLYPILPYPKNESKRYEATHQVSVQVPLF